MAETAHQFTNLLEKKRKKIVQAWFQGVVDTYPPKTSEFLSSQKDQFANPIGANLARDLDLIFGELLREQSTDALPSAVDGIVRVRAVQDFPPSAAVGCFLMLKRIIRQSVGAQIREQNLARELAAFDDKVDQLMLVAFESYMKCRETIWELKAKEAQHRTKNLLRRKAGVDWTVSDSLEPAE
ncbi:MAG: RsbRD N-terminal domain-containing protein [Desulfovermiculus sp.]